MTIKRDKEYFRKIQEHWRRRHGKMLREEYLTSIRKPGYCADCKLTKPLSEFSKNKARPNGIQHVCRDCMKKRYKEWQDCWTPSYKEQLRQRNNAATKIYKRNPLNKIKLAARYMVAGALRAGLLQPQPCKQCGSIKAEAHHFDYTKPLEVLWLCRIHHREAHASKSSSPTRK